ncbi:MAG: LacI family DNA-binding transcriptional regulator [Anaerolineales bacterium]|nr:LacI family DNA-binding transcriptional regulator [Anaerolineales bacterium]
MSRATLKDVAAKAGVSYQTVSKVLNRRAQVSPETERRIRHVANELNYRPNAVAQNLRQQSSHLIGYAWGSGGSKTWRPVNNRFLHSVVYACEAQGYFLTFFTTKDESLTDIKAYEDLYGRRQVDGFILENTTENDLRIHYLLAEKIPFVAFGRVEEDLDFCWVDVDGYYGIYCVADYLLQRGHQRIALISWQRGATTRNDRERGYYCRLQEAGIVPDSAWVYRGVNEIETGARGIIHLLSLPQERRPTAVVCVSDQIAVGAMNAAMAEGLEVGKDIAITGYDDINMAQFLHPPLTTVRQPIDEAGELVANMLLGQINGTIAVPQQVLLKPELVIRSSA